MSDETEKVYEEAVIRATAAPFIIVSTRALLDPLVTPAALRVLLAMCWHENQAHMCWASQDTIASELRLSRQAVSRQQLTLTDLGYIELVRRGFRGKKIANKYRIVRDPHTQHGVADDDLHTQHDVAPEPSIRNMTLRHTQHDVAQKRTNEKDHSSITVSSYPNSVVNSPSLAPAVAAQVGAAQEPAQPRRPQLDRAAMQRDPLFVALVASLGYGPHTPREWDNWRYRLNAFHKVAATPDDIACAVSNFCAKWPDRTVTIDSIEKHWTILTSGEKGTGTYGTGLAISGTARKAMDQQRAENERTDAERREREHEEAMRILSDYMDEDDQNGPRKSANRR